MTTSTLSEGRAQNLEPGDLVINDRGSVVLIERTLVRPGRFSGTVIHSNPNDGGAPLGFYAETWDLTVFHPYVGKITLERK